MLTLGRARLGLQTPLALCRGPGAVRAGRAACTCDGCAGSAGAGGRGIGCGAFLGARYKLNLEGERTMRPVQSRMSLSWAVRPSAPRAQESGITQKRP